MQTTGILRKMDALGRIVIPTVLRENMNLQENDTFEFFVDRSDNMIGIKIVQPENTTRERATDYFRKLTTEEKTDFILTLLSESEEVTKSVIYDIFEKKF